MSARAAHLAGDIVQRAALVKMSFYPTDNADRKGIVSRRLLLMRQQADNLHHQKCAVADAERFAFYQRFKTAQQRFNHRLYVADIKYPRLFSPTAELTQQHLLTWKIPQVLLNN